MRRILLATALALPALAFAQGQLTPPDGAVGPRGPVPTMKTLTQVEPRTPLEPGAPGVSPSMNGGLIIDEPGSYYLTGNLTVSSGNAIDIGASNVTLDLNGFTILSTAGENVVRGAGIELSGSVTNVTIRNGHIRGTSHLNGAAFIRGGFDHGITAPDSSTSNLADNVGVVGIAQNGINLPNGSTVTHCSASLCGITGINATVVSDSVAEDCSLMGINAKTAENCFGKGAFAGIYTENASNCRGEATTFGNGLYAAVSATNCSGLNKSGPGLTCGLALNCRGQSITEVGLTATTATGCYGTSNGSTGLSARSASNCQAASAAGTGLFCDTATDCYAISSSSIGLDASRTTTGCYGSTSTGAYGLRAGAAAENCYGYIEINTGTGTALGTAVALNCRGKSLGSGPGVTADSATNCYGESASGIGLQAKQNATGCTGTTASGSNGLLVGDTGAAGTAENCRGIVTGGTGIGLAAETAANCFGQSTAGTGLIAATATNCSAYTASGAIAMRIDGSANNCRGNNSKAGGIAIQATIAVSCTTAGGTISAPNKYNMP